ncbi:hypothetical protein Y1Q_0022842 [Alligator mississippiensis]|uniref:Uncharacterized protein n=1 Tax=Alligator mississippiensis TaxID=8496 RepID=A0A151N4Q8_ALLMI|nr:hypothetical protein Y1Q_0022842 [Alligator mississippiensis]
MDSIRQHHYIQFGKKVVYLNTVVLDAIRRRGLFHQKDLWVLSPEERAAAISASWTIMKICERFLETPNPRWAGRA